MQAGASPTTQPSLLSMSPLPRPPSIQSPQVVAMLNGQQMGGKRRSAYYYDLWCVHGWWLCVCVAVVVVTISGVCDGYTLKAVCAVARQGIGPAGGAPLFAAAACTDQAAPPHVCPPQVHEVPAQVQVGPPDWCVGLCSWANGMLSFLPGRQRCPTHSVLTRAPAAVPTWPRQFHCIACMIACR